MRIPTIQYERLIAGATITVHTPAIPASITKGDTTNIYGYRSHADRAAGDKR